MALGTRGLRLLLALLTTALVGQAASAVTATYTLSSGGGLGILAGNGLACTSIAACGGTPDFANASLELAGGTLDIVDSASPGFPTGTLSLAMPSITLTGGPVGGVDEIILTGLSVSFSYGAFGLIETAIGGGLLSITSISTPTATISGTVEGKLGGATVIGPTPLSELATASTLNCIVAPGQCGFQIDFTSTVGSPLEFRIVGNLSAVPEPAQLALLAFAVLSLAGARRR